MLEIVAGGLVGVFWASVEVNISICTAPRCSFRSIIRVCSTIRAYFARVEAVAGAGAGAGAGTISEISTRGEASAGAGVGVVAAGTISEVSAQVEAVAGVGAGAGAGAVSEVSARVEAVDGAGADTTQRYIFNRISFCSRSDSVPNTTFVSIVMLKVSNIYFYGSKSMQLF